MSQINRARLSAQANGPHGYHSKLGSCTFYIDPLKMWYVPWLAWHGTLHYGTNSSDNQNWLICLKQFLQVEAAKIGSEAEVRKLLDEGEDPNSHEDNKV